MRSKKRSSTPTGRLQVLAEFRHQLRLFLHLSEAAAEKLGLQPQHHQLLLQVAGARDGVSVTITYAAKRLSLRHHTVVELSKRCEEAGLLIRKQDETDRRRVLLKLSPRGQELLKDLSIYHAHELNELAPQLIQTLTMLRALHRKSMVKQVGGGL